MEFSKTYNRDEFLNFLRKDFLPDDFSQVNEPVVFATKTTYSKQATKLGICKSLDLVVYEIKHSGKDDPRVGLSKEAFRMLSEEWQSRALVLFAPENNANNYRFSLIEIQLEGDQTSAKVHRKYSNPRRYSYLLGEGIGGYTPNKYLAKDGARVVDFKDLENRFSIEVLTKEFYQKLYQWYLFAIDESTGVTFPNKTITDADDRENISVKIIRLITRVLFVWFIKQKKLVPEPIFDEKFLHTILIDFDPKSRENGDYYCAILQNLFFATINRAVVDDEGNPRRFAALKDKRDVRNLYRYAEMFSISEEAILELFEKVPFLNGGLFECLDKFKSSDILGGEDRYYDGFSRNSIKSASGNYRYRAFVPNVLFFNDDQNQPGLLNLLKQYNFTIEENSSTDIQVSLDPELLGCVFENLLASFNPETQESARKSTGSFYTPRPVVEYMVQEALTAHLLRHCGELDQSDIERFFKTHIKPEAWSEQVCAKMADTLQEMKILDPACGSGAFPMGCLLSMMEIIDLLDRQNSDRYGLKLKIIENCIYGVDIQPIAMLITKLRFFISLICEQDDIDFSDKENNYGINTLPNLETKFVAANSLISADIRKFNKEWTNDEELTKLKDDLLRIRHEHFCARSQYRKQRNRSADQAKRDEIMDLIVRHSSTPDQKKIDLFLSSIAKCKEDLELCSTEQWVEEWVTPQATLFEPPRPTLLRRDVNKDRRDELLRMIKQYREAISAEQNKSLLQGFEAAVEQVTQWNPYDQNSTSPFFDPEWMFGLCDGFDVVIGNPPYISTKGITVADKQKYEFEFGFSDDTYNLFTFKGISLLAHNGSLTYITPKTFWTTQTKRNMRDFILSKTIRYIFDTANPFESAMVDTCITQVINNPFDQANDIRFLDGSKDLLNPIAFTPIKQSVYCEAQNKVIFKPTSENLRIYELYGQKVKELHDQWWDKIKTSRDIEKNKLLLEQYRSGLKPGDVALLGCLTEGGQGLATANNGKFIAIRKSTKWAKNVLESRPKKLAEAILKHKIHCSEIGGLSPQEYLQIKSEKEIAETFDALKEKYGRDIFGQGYIYRLIDDTEMADVEKLTIDERDNGIDLNKRIYVPYDKGDKDGNRWYLETPFAIAWSRENVQFLKTNSGKKGKGMPVVRNFQFNFREGFCWNNLLNPHARLLKAKIKLKSVNDVGSMSLSSIVKLVPNYYIITLLNSELIFGYYREYVNCTVNIQINDLRQIPFIVPTEQQLHSCEQLFNRIVALKAQNTICYENETQNNKEIQIIEMQMNIFVNKLYAI